MSTSPRSLYRGMHWGDEARRADRVLVRPFRVGKPIARLASIAYSTTKAGDHNRWQHDFACDAWLLQDAAPLSRGEDRIEALERDLGAMHALAAEKRLGIAPAYDAQKLVQLGVLYELADVQGRRLVLPGVDVCVAWDAAHKINAVVLCGPPWLRYQIGIVYDAVNGSAPYVTEHGIEG